MFKLEDGVDSVISMLLPPKSYVARELDPIVAPLGLALAMSQRGAMVSELVACIE